MNKVMLIGRVGKTPEVRETTNSKVASFSFATSEKYKEETKTEWHNVKVWGKLADVIEKYVNKEDQLYLEGKVTYGSYENKDGATIYITEIIGSNMHFVGSKDKPDTKEGEWKKGEKREVKSMSDPDELPGYIDSDAPDGPF